VESIIKMGELKTVHVTKVYRCEFGVSLFKKRVLEKPQTIKYTFVNLIGIRKETIEKRINMSMIFPGKDQKYKIPFLLLLDWRIFLIYCNLLCTKFYKQY